MAIRIERPDACVADGSLPPANQRHLAGNSTGINPGRYTLGTAALLAPFAAIVREPARLFLAELALGVATIALAWRLARSLGGLVAAAFAAFVLAISPFHAIYSTLVMSEVPSAFVVAAVAIGFAKWAHGARRSLPLAAIGAGCGLAAALRPANALLLLPLLVWLLLAPRDRGGPAQLRSAATLLAGCAVVVGVEIAARRALLGGVAPTGYHYWLPDEFASLDRWYSLRFLFEAPRSGWRQGNLKIYLDGMTGWRATIWTPLSAALAFVGVVSAARRWRDPILLACVLFPIATLLFYLPYYSRDQRMLLVAAPFLAALAGLGAAELARRFTSPLAATALLLVLAAGALFAPGSRGRFGVFAELEKRDRALS